MNLISENQKVSNQSKEHIKQSEKTELEFLNQDENSIMFCEKLDNSVIYAWRKVNNEFMFCFVGWNKDFHQNYHFFKFPIVPKSNILESLVKFLNRN